MKKILLFCLFAFLLSAEEAFEQLFDEPSPYDENVAPDEPISIEEALEIVSEDFECLEECPEPVLEFQAFIFENGVR